MSQHTMKLQYDWDQPVHLSSLIRVFADSMCLLLTPGYPKRDEPEPCYTGWIYSMITGWIYSMIWVCWSHRSHCRFCWRWLICCGYLWQAPQQGISNEYHNICFSAKIRKNISNFQLKKKKKKTLSGAMAVDFEFDVFPASFFLV